MVGHLPRAPRAPGAGVRGRSRTIHGQEVGVSRRNRAQLRILQVERGVRQFQVECGVSLTTTTWAEGLHGPEMTDDHLAALAMGVHRERREARPVCDLRAAWDRVGPETRLEIERITAAAGVGLDDILG